MSRELKKCPGNCYASLYTDMGIVKCQYCMGLVSMGKASLFLAYNGHTEKEIEEYIKKYDFIPDQPND